MRTLKASSSLDGWRSMILEMNGQRRELQIKFDTEMQCRKFSGMIQRMKRPPRVETNVHTATITFNHYRYAKSKYNHDRQPLKVSPVTTVAPA